MIEISYLGEPRLQFGSYFEYDDAKTGLAEFGPFGKCIAGLHKETIRVGFVGIRGSISSAKEWIEQCGHPIQSENIKAIHVSPSGGLFDEEEALQRMRLEKMLNRDFVGFNRETPFGCCFQVNERWERIIPAHEVDLALKSDDKAERINHLVELFLGRIGSLASTNPKPDILVVVLTDEMVLKADRVRLAGNFYLDFRRALKAAAMRWDVPTQLVQQRTLQGKSGVQEKASRAWNFCTAAYYKAEGVPWRPLTLDHSTCYIGISFHVAQGENAKLTMRSSLAQAFDYLGQGLVLRGDPFRWDVEKMGRSPHLPVEAARKLLIDTLDAYRGVTNQIPNRVVIHKTSVFWGEEHAEYNELDAIRAGIADVYPHAEADFVALRQTGVRLFREGKYPPLRSTYLCISGEHHLVYTMGYTPYLETYPGGYVPQPWQITQHIGGSSPKDLLREVLALTKMNVNNCSYADGTPITLSFSRKIGEIMKHIPQGGEARPEYRFYM